VAGLLVASAAAEEGTGPIITGVDPIAALQRMASATRTVEYEGTLVYLHGHQLTSLRIAHRIDAGESRESLLALNGPIRALARNPRGVTCVLPDAHAISVKRAPATKGVLRRAALDPERLAPHYLIHPLGESRVAGRDTDVVGIIPRDNLRYGYRFYVDRDTGLPLKTDLMDNGATPIEQVMFTDLTIVGDGASATAAPAESESAGSATPAFGPDSTDDGWHFAALPPGFRVIAHEIETGSPEHLMVSDGLASVSVYIEPDNGAGLRGAAHMGAINAAGRLLEGHQVTAVGEVPPQTIDAILAALHDTP